MFQSSVAGSVSGSISLADPLGSSPLVAAVDWLQGTLLGTVATTIAIVAVAAVGLMMLAGRVDFRRGATVICGCFILFGATSIAAGIRIVATGAGSNEAPVVAAFAAPPASPLPREYPTPTPAPYDPYAGASAKTAP